VAASVLLASGLAIIGSGDRFWTAQAASPEVSTIAVLPFVDLSPDGNLAYFCDGMTEELIDSLTKISGFRVAARTSSSAFKGTNQDIRDIAKKLNVGYVLEGSVRKDGHVVRVTAQLNNAADGYQLWSETYERQLNDVFAIEDDISKAIAGALKTIRR
jgi:adenylate cyclase